MSRALASAERALFWALAAAVFAAVLGGLGARALYRVAEHNEAQTKSFAIARIIAPEGPEAMIVAEAVLNQSELVRAAAPISAEQVARVIESLGGAPVGESEIPQLRMFELELAPFDAGEDVGASISAVLAEAGVTAEIMLDNSAQQSWDWGRLRRIVLACAIGFAVLMAFVVTFAARGFAARRRDLIQVMTDLGVARGKTCGRVADEAAAAGFWAGLVGALAAGAAALAVLVLMFEVPLADLTVVLLPIDAAPLAAAPLAAAVAAAMGARAAAESFYDQAARLG